MNLIKGITSNLDLENLAKEVNIKINCFFKNELPIIPYEGNYIINLASSNDESGGSHWVSCKLTKEHGINKALYFDSFGLPEPILVNKFILKWVKNKHNNIIRNINQIQNINSNYCGEYSILFLKEINSKTINLKQQLYNFISQFRNYN